VETYDIVVVGAGPAGLLASKKAAEGGAQVLLVEKEGEFGVKACAEALSKDAVLDAELKPSSNFISNEIVGAYIYAPDENKKVEISMSETGYGGYVVNKPLFLKELAEAAAAKGVDIRVKSKVVDVKRDGKLVKVMVFDGAKTVEVKAKILVGCDGVNSIVAEKFFNRENYQLISCIQYKLADCNLDNERVTRFYLGRKVAPMGYLWIFPKGRKLANVGVGVRGEPAKKYLDQFIETHVEEFRNSKVVKVEAAPIPISGQLDEIVSDNIMICGDAAGQVIPLTGGGIHSSIAAGKIAGEVAAEAVKENDASKARLMEYPNRFNSYWGERIRKSLKALRVMEKLSDDDLNQLANILTGKDVIDLANGLNVERVAMMLMKHPVFAMKIAKFLLS
jgi:digeranylgeranylglycerophospholipid reductase